MLCLLLFGRKKEREREMASGFFPRAGHALMAVLCRIFMDVRYN
jgi:hypothetical protein